MAATVILETDRLILREYCEADAAVFLQLNSDPAVMRFVPDPLMKDVEEARRILVTHPIADYSRHGYGRWACCLKQTGEHVGFCGLKYLPEIEEVDLGFRFGRSHWGKGFATESAQASIRYGFDTLRLNEIIGLSHPENYGSIRVLEKLGLQFAGIVKPYGWPMRRYVIRRAR